VRKRKRKRIATVERKPLPTPTGLAQSWSMDFVSDGFAHERRFRCLNLVDDYTRECLAIEIDTSLPGLRVSRVLQRLAEMRGLSVLRRRRMNGWRWPRLCQNTFLKR
jgi:putative transposase